MRLALTLSLAVLGWMAAHGAAAQTYEPYPYVVLGGMDKVTARFTSFTVPVGSPAQFGTLEVTPRSCQKTPPEETPESTAFLEIDEVKDEERQRIFNGWMFASSPGVSALEHPVYDVWVMDCSLTAYDEVSEDGEGGSEAEPDAESSE
ncbi:MAG: DUF2155 domain-containing protein [Pseudomonadota bacterium]